MGKNNKLIVVPMVGIIMLSSLSFSLKNTGVICPEPVRVQKVKTMERSKTK